MTNTIGKIIKLPCLLACLLLIISCAANEKKLDVTSPLATPEYYVQVGQRLIAQGDLTGARSSFSQALDIDGEYYPALFGTAKVWWLEKAYDDAEKALQLAKKYATGDADKLDIAALEIRLVTAKAENDWLKQAQRIYSRAGSLKQADSHSGLQLAMGLAWVQEGAFNKAQPLLSSVISIGGEDVAEADEEWQRIQMIQRAQPASPVARELAYRENLNKGEFAALVIQELNLPQLLRQDIGEPAVGEQSAQGLADYDNNAFKADIVAAHRLGLRSLRVVDGRFSPQEPVDRLDLAMLVEDVLYLKNGVSRTLHLGSESPFIDLGSSHTGFNAMMTAVTRGYIDGTDDGKVHPTKAVSGAEVLLVIRRLKDNLN